MVGLAAIIPPVSAWILRTVGAAGIAFHHSLQYDIHFHNPLHSSISELGHVVIVQ